MADGHGFADYMLFVEGKAVGVLEAKPAGYPLTSVELQADKYATSLPAGLTPPGQPASVLVHEYRRRDALRRAMGGVQRSRQR